ncbi:MAG: carbohydrate binding family 9 domain-containing protein [Candidatus Aminicenantes bacterium]|nr:MAG: carbohydrate binding family 9 domain-containing protein [Candidatus Aminicenantes bacterium]
MNYKKSIRFFMIVLFFFASSFLFSLDSSECEISAHRISLPINLDGDLSESSWKEARFINNLTQREPNEGASATEPTEIRILYDNQYLYIGVVCFDSQPHKIVANEMRRDSELEDNDYFEIFIDTFHDHRNAFYFIINPLGAKRDALIRDEGGSINWNWDGIWEVKVRRTNQGWTAEIAIPFYTLRFKKSQNQTWGINFGRQVARKREESYWAPILRDYGYFGKYKISYCGHLTGLENLSKGKRVHLMPYLIGGGVQEEGEESLNRSGDLGIDLKYRLTSDITLDMTINTDFAQVEADQEQFNLTRFSLFFPEKRGFFLEGADIFRAGERYREHEPPSSLFFFSRTIGLSEDGAEIPIIGGARVTGKAGGYTLGILDILTDRISYMEDDEQVDIEKTNFSVFRLKRDFLDKSTVGVMFLSKDSLDSPSYNRGAAFDFNLAFGQSLQMGGFAARTFSPELKGNDWAAYLDFLYNSDFLGIDVSYTDIGENFNSEMGFIPREDIRKLRANFGIGPRPNILNIRQTFLFNNLTYIENHSGQLESRNITTGMFNLFQDGSYLFLGYVRNYEYLDEEFEIKEDVFIPIGVHRFNQLVSFFESDKSKKIAFGGSMNRGQFFNGNLFRVSVNGFLKLSKNLNLQLIYDRNRFDLPVKGGKFTINIVASRVICSFTPDLFAKAFVQWNDEEDIFISNFLIRWIYKPGASIYFIYNESRHLGLEGYLEDRVVMFKVNFLFN